ncbi:MAG: FAD-dependent oxidoreductase [Alphaproteobacteria bacterium]|nr:FAD-dependent oxidoreductase [Alphaproteobacteria bacterium]
MDRRRLLKWGLAAGTLGTTGVAGGLTLLGPQRMRWPAIGDGTRDRPDVPRRVAVIGGGLAGMAASAALAARGYTVDLYEQSDALGGKLSGWPVRVGDVEMPMEHGFHGFFSQYYNLLELLAEAGADGDLVRQDGYGVLYRDRPAERFGNTVTPFPYELLEVVARSRSLGLGDVAGDRPGMRELLAYDPVRTFARWDGVDVETFVRETRLDGAFADLILRPFGQASMNALTGFSAAEAIRFFHFYMLGNPEGLGFSALGRGCHLAVIAPLQAHLERLGVRVHLRTPVRRVAFDGGHARGVVLGGAGAVPEVRVDAASVPERGWVAVGAVFVRRTEAGFEARDSRCTHMGCPVALAADGGFVCPCHAGRYDGEGRNVAGPPPRPLDRLDAREESGEVVVRGVSAADEELVPADAVVLAMEVRGLRALSEASDLRHHAPVLARAAESEGEADPYSVVRFWLDRPVDPARTAFYTVADYPWTDGLAVYSSFQASARDWAERTGGSIVESHAYAIPPGQQGSLETYRDGLLAELREALPELAEARVVHEEAMTQSNFTRFAPGDHARRPSTATDVANLFVAGDHVRLPFPAFLMEAAVASGRLAANHVLAADRVREVAIPTVAWRGKLADLV